MTTKTIRILIADDHSLIRQGLKTIIEFQENLSVVCECDNGTDALANMSVLKPDVAIIDINMPGKTGLEVLKEARDSGFETKIIMLTVESDRKTLMSAIEFGADGFILKDSDAKDIIDAMHEVIKGENYIDKRLVKLLIYDLKHKDDDHNDEVLFSELTSREFDVLELISQGMTNAEIAEELFLSEKTVKNYASSVFRKLDVKDRVQAALYAIKNDIEKYRIKEK